ATTYPDHAQSGFPTTCAACHSTSAWQPAAFDHDTTAFPLTGAHRTTDCLSCHSQGYTGTPTACVACHQSDYDGTNDPNHQAANFPTSCQECHSTTAWTPANWDHDNQYFPIYSGKHRGEWNSCTECHVVATDYGAFECILCHEHNQTDMDRKHQGEARDYQYLSSACYQCHPDGTVPN
ncbi:cytochrome c3 family protein, partial [bacterium]|nr:cytochrome c3 family protein [bacterium]